MKINKIFSEEVIEKLSVEQRDTLLKNLLYLSKKVLSQDTLLNVENYKDLESIIPVDVVKDLLSFLYGVTVQNEKKVEIPDGKCAITDSNEKGKKVITDKKADENQVDSQWIYISAFNQYITHLSDQRYRIIEKHDVKNCFICFVNDIDLNKILSSDLGIYKQILLQNISSYDASVSEELRLVSTINQTIQLEDSDDIYISQDEVNADLWIALNKEIK